jgi:hypothetical protein
LAEGRAEQSVGKWVELRVGTWVEL